MISKTTKVTDELEKILSQNSEAEKVQGFLDLRLSHSPAYSEHLLEFKHFLEKKIKENRQEKCYFYFLGIVQYDLDYLKDAEKAILQALDLDRRFSGYYVILGSIRRKLTDHRGALEAYNNGIIFSEAPVSGKFYHNRGALFLECGAYTKAESDLKKAVEIEKERPTHLLDSYQHTLGRLYLKIHRYTKASEQFEEIRKRFANNGEKKDPRLYYLASSGLATIYFKIHKEKGEVEDHLNKSIQIYDKSFFDSIGEKYSQLAHFTHGLLQMEIEDYRLGNSPEFKNDSYKKSIETFKNIKNEGVVHGLSLVQLGKIYSRTNRYKEALETYKELEKEPIDPYFQEMASVKVEELTARVNEEGELGKIYLILEEIEEKLKFKEEKICHYTEMGVADALILNWSPFRASESSFMNDPSEGRELIEFLNANPDNMGKNSPLYEFVRKPFLNSFTPNEKLNDLTMWRFYGKDGTSEANGCSISFNVERFQLALVKSVVPPEKEHDFEYAIRKEDFSFYRVAYLSKSENEIRAVILPGVPNGEEIGKKILDKLVDLQGFLKSIKTPWPEHLKERIFNLANLFKTDAYQHEQEVRLILPQTGFHVNIEPRGNGLSPKVYIELTDLFTSIEGITIGPKAVGRDQWAAAFRHHLDKYSFEHVKVQISTLPYR